MIELIFKKGNTLPIEARLICLRILYDISVNANRSHETCSIDLSNQKLKESYGASNEQSKQVRDFLSTSKFVNVKKTKAGFSDCSYSNKNLMVLKQKIDNLSYTKLKLIRQILGEESPSSELKNLNNLKLRKSNQFLMVTLTLLSDELGIVQEVTHAHLRRLLGGISSDRLKNQLKTLVSFKFILGVSHGGTCPIYFGKYSSLYCIDLNFFTLNKEIVTSEIIIDSFLTNLKNKVAKPKCLFSNKTKQPIKTTLIDDKAVLNGNLTFRADFIAGFLFNVSKYISMIECKVYSVDEHKINIRGFINRKHLSFITKGRSKLSEEILSTETDLFVDEVAKIANYLIGQAKIITSTLNLKPEKIRVIFERVVKINKVRVEDMYSNLRDTYSEKNFDIHLVACDGNNTTYFQIKPCRSLMECGSENCENENKRSSCHYCSVCNVVEHRYLN